MTRAEQIAAEDDAKRQERGPRSSRRAKVSHPQIARTYVQAKHPETGEAVTFVPGEALPAWVTLKPEEKA